MGSLVHELQHEALQPEVLVATLLRKALVVASKLGMDEFRAWVERELNGYDDATDAPSYRSMFGQIRGREPNRGTWVPIQFENSEQGEMLSWRKTQQPVSEIEHMLARGDKGTVLHMPLPLELQRRLTDNFKLETEVALFTSQSALAGVLDAVRNVILNWSLKLEADGILGTGLTFSKAKKEAATHSPQNVNNFYGPVANSQIQQGNAQATQIYVEVQVT